MSEEQIDIKEEELEPDVEIKDEIQENSMAQNTSIADRDKLIGELDEHREHLTYLRWILCATRIADKGKQRTAVRLVDQIKKKKEQYQEAKRIYRILRTLIMKTSQDLKKLISERTRGGSLLITSRSQEIQTTLQDLRTETIKIKEELHRQKQEDEEAMELIKTLLETLEQ